MSAQDGMWLRLDRPENLLTVVSVLWTAEPVDPAALRRLLAERLVGRHGVFRRRPVLRTGLLAEAHWEDDPDFDLDRHLRVGVLPAPGSAAQLQEFVGSLRSVPPEPGHPPWVAHLLQGYGTGSAVVLQLHHAVADGIRMTQLMVELLDPLAPGPAVPVTTRGTGDGRRWRPRDLLNPVRALAAATATATAVRDTATGLLTLASWSNPRTAWSGPVGIAKTVAWSDPVPLAVLSGLARATGTSVNDVCLALVSGAVRRRLGAAGPGEPVPDDLGWMVPVNLEPFDAALPAALGNHFSLILVVLPLGGGFRERVREIHERGRRIRLSWEPWVTWGLVEVIGRAPGALGPALARFLADKTVGVLTNVPGPRVPMAIAGAPVTGVVGWAPCSAGQVLTACVFSYAGNVVIGFAADADRVGDAGLLVADLATELTAALDEGPPDHPRT